MKIETYRDFDIHLSEWVQRSKEPYLVATVVAVPPDPTHLMFRAIMTKAANDPPELIAAKLQNALASVRAGVDRILSGEIVLP